MDYRDPEWVAERLGVDKNTVYKFLNEGTIPAVQLGRKWLISEARLEQWLAEETDRQTQDRRRSVSKIERTVRQMSNLSCATKALLREAYSHARRLNTRHLGQEHLLLAMAGDVESPAGRMLRDAGIIAASLGAAVERASPLADDQPLPRSGRKPLTRRAMRLARHHAAAIGAKRVEPEHLLLGILQSADGMGVELLKAHGITFDTAHKHLAASGKKSKSKETS